MLLTMLLSPDRTERTHSQQPYCAGERSELYNKQQNTSERYYLLTTKGNVFTPVLLLTRSEYTPFCKL